MDKDFGSVEKDFGSVEKDRTRRIGVRFKSVFARQQAKIGQQRKGKGGEIKADSKGEEICKDQRGKESRSQGGESKEKRQSSL